MNYPTIIATCSAAVSAIASLVSIGVNLCNNKKMYKANLERKSKLDLLQSIRILVPEYIASVDYALYLYIKASADENDKMQDEVRRLAPGVKYGNTTFEDYSKQLNEAKSRFFDLKNNLAIYKANNLEEYVDRVWHILDTKRLNGIKSNATNGGLSTQEVNANNYMNKHSKELIDHFNSWYNQEFNKLTK